MSKEKGIDLALEAALELVKIGRSFKWYVIGDGGERYDLETKIKEYHLENRFILLGLKANPYPYLKHAFLYVQPSRYEGKSIAIDEAKILAKPIITTNYPTTKTVKPKTAAKKTVKPKTKTAAKTDISKNEPNLGQKELFEAHYRQYLTDMHLDKAKKAKKAAHFEFKKLKKIMI